MSLREKLALLSVKKRYHGVDVSCRASLQSEYQIYLGRHPSYLSFQDEQDAFSAVSYTHLTLPTICSV